MQSFRPRSGSKSSKFLLLCVVLLTVLALALAGCKGSDGANGTPGLNAPTTGTVSGTVKTAVGAVALAGVSVTTNPVVTGATATTAADGSYSLSLPGGSYTLTFAATHYTTATANVNVANGVGTPANVTLAEAASGAPSVALVASGNDVGYGQDFIVTATATSPIGATLSYSWTGLKTASTTNTGTATSQSFASAIAGAPAPSTDPGSYVSPFSPETRLGVLPINADTRGAKSVSVKVSDGQGGVTSASVSVNSAVPQPGVRQLTLGVAAYINSGSSSTTQTWSLNPPACSALTASSISTASTGTVQIASFTPDCEGAYGVVSSSGTLTVYGAKFVGALQGATSVANAYTTKTISASDPQWDGIWITIPAGASSVTYTDWPTVTNMFNSNCTACHQDGTTAIDEFSPWSQTSHATFYARGIEGITANSNSCVACHTVGSDGVNVGNNGYDDRVASTGFVYAKGIGGWGTVATYQSGTVAAVSNIQCENCHGAQGTNMTSGTPGSVNGHRTAGVGGDTNYVSNETSSQAARVSFSADVCGTCHSSGTSHHYYSEWNTLNPDTGQGHSKKWQLDAYINPATGKPGHAQSTNGVCARCHTAQGFSIYAGMITSGNSGTIPPSQIVWDKTNAQPQTCTACHDPHDVSNPNQLRVYNGGFVTMSGVQVDGLGKGAICTVCHNIRGGLTCQNATLTSTGACDATGYASTTFLHEDTDATANKPLADTPHDNSQADVLMGRNAFFMQSQGTQLPMLSKHANVEDSCAGCHMALNPQTRLSHGAATVNSHVWYITDAARPALCANCHSSNVTGNALVASTDDLLSTLGQKLSAYLVSGVSTTVYVGSNHLQMSVTNASWVGDGNFSITGNLQSNGTSTTISSSTARITTDSAGTTPYFAVGTSYSNTDKIYKGVWNLMLIENDMSHGIHNPTFVTTVLNNTIAQF